MDRFRKLAELNALATIVARVHHVLFTSCRSRDRRILQNLRAPPSSLSGRISRRWNRRIYVLPLGQRENEFNSGGVSNVNPRPLRDARWKVASRQADNIDTLARVRAYDFLRITKTRICNGRFPFPLSVFLSLSSRVPFSSYNNAVVEFLPRRSSRENARGRVAGRVRRARRREYQRIPSMREKWQRYIKGVVINHRPRIREPSVSSRRRGGLSSTA